MKKSVVVMLFSLFSGAIFGNTNMNTEEQKLEVITLGAGCFWCVEAIFQELKGVEKVESGYMGGETKNPTYKEVCSGETGHAEVCQVTYNPSVVNIDDLLEVFWQTHNPTTLNRQGADVGTQYRSVIFYHSDLQKEKAEAYKKELNEAGAWDNPVVTEITPASTFYRAENYHQNYFSNNKSQAYCNFVIKPKIEKFKKIFNEKLR